MSLQERVISIILGGGQGTRLAPLTNSRSKPAVPIGGKYRLVDIPISNCLNSGIYKMFVLTQFNSASLNKHIKNTYHFSHFSKAFVDILAAEQTVQNNHWFQGTADAVRQCMHHFVNYDYDYVLILSGDQLYQMDFTAMIQAHRNSGAQITIATTPVHEQQASAFGIMKTNSEDIITDFIEKPQENLQHWISDTGPEMAAQGRNYLASMGIYVFNRDFLIEVLKHDEEEKDFGKEILPRSILSNKVLSYQYEGYWTDIGDIASFFEANLELTNELPQFNMFDNTKAIFTRSRMLPPSKIMGTTLVHALIADGCIIYAERIERAVLGVRARIGVGTIIQNSYIMGLDAYQDLVQMSDLTAKGQPYMGIGDRCFINNAIVDKNCCIGHDVKINGGKHLSDGDHGFYAIKDGIVVVKKGSVVPNGTVI